ncbi:flagellar motor protein MotA, partial [Caulobacter sp. 17J65-9]|nr:flagellar motor protein MotA [Caulobacter sp. 17J65-9]
MLETKKTNILLAMVGAAALLTAAPAFAQDTAATAAPAAEAAAAPAAAPAGDAAAPA